MKKYLVAYAAVLFIMSPLPAQADITIGVVIPMTGGVALGGEQIKRGAEQAVADINAKGGINGEKLNLYVADDACDPKQGVEVANKIASAGIKFVTGFYCSSSAIPASKIYMEEGVLMVSAAASNPRLTDEAKDLVFRVYGRDDQQGAFDADYILKHFRGKKIALLNDQSAWGVGLTDAIKKNINQSGVVEVLSDSFSTGGKDYSFLVSKLKQARADVLFLAAFPTEAGLITRQLKEQDTHIQVIGGDALTTDEFWKIAGPTAEGVLMSFTSDPRKFTEAQVVVDEFRNSGFEPDGVTLYTYGAIQVIAEGIKRAGKTNTQKIATALRQGPIYTVLGDLSFNSKGDVPKRSYVMYRWHDGKYAEAEQ